MTTNGATKLKWPDKERTYRLGLGEIAELQTLCDAGPEEMFRGMAANRWRVEWARETIRLGLIGGGLDPQRALGLVGKYLQPGRLMEAKGVAQQILFAALCGDMLEDEADESPKVTAEETNGGSISRPSTDQGPSSDGLQGKSISFQ